MALLTTGPTEQQRGANGSPYAPDERMRSSIVIAVLAGLTCVFVFQKQREPARTPSKLVPAAEASIAQRPVSPHDWMKNSLDRANEVKRQVAQQRAAGTK